MKFVDFGGFLFIRLLRDDLPEFQLEQGRLSRQRSPHPLRYDSSPLDQGTETRGLDRDHCLFSTSLKP